MAEVKAVDRERPLTAKYEKRKVSKHPDMQSVGESNALKNWHDKMQERKKQQGHLSSKHQF